jgi:hypothetical protein
MESFSMKKNLHLIASVDKPEILENIIEKLAMRRYDIGYCSVKLPYSWQAIDTSSIESYITGTIEFDYNETYRIRIPYITSFFFSCTKKKNNPYDLEWSVSLS